MIERIVPIDEVKDACLFYFKKHYDNRGYFLEFYSSAHSYPLKTNHNVQVNVSCSKKGVLRGLHVAPFSKLVGCLRGKIFDVVVDVRRDSPTYLKWYGIVLSEYDNKQLYVPPDCAHGFLSMEDGSIAVYTQDGVYNPDAEYEVRWNDESFDVFWPDLGMDYILSDKDRLAPTWQEILARRTKDGSSNKNQKEETSQDLS